MIKCNIYFSWFAILYIIIMLLYRWIAWVSSHVYRFTRTTLTSIETCGCPPTFTVVYPGKLCHNIISCSIRLSLCIDRSRAVLEHHINVKTNGDVPCASKCVIMGYYFITACYINFIAAHPHPPPSQTHIATLCSTFNTAAMPTGHSCHV